MFTSLDRITLSGKSFHRSTTLAVKLFLHNSNLFLLLYNFIEIFLPGLSLNCKEFIGYTFDLSFKILYTWIISALWCLSVADWPFTFMPSNSPSSEFSDILSVGQIYRTTIFVVELSSVGIYLCRFDLALPC